MTLAEELSLMFLEEQQLRQEGEEAELIRRVEAAVHAAGTITVVEYGDDFKGVAVAFEVALRAAAETQGLSFEVVQDASSCPRNPLYRYGYKGHTLEA